LAEYDLSIISAVSMKYRFGMFTKKCTWFRAKPKSPNSNPEALQVMERPNAGVDIDLFSKTVISVVGFKHHGHPVIAGVTRNLFRATAHYIHYTIFFSFRVREGQARACRVRQKRVWFDGRKKRCSFPSAGLTLCSRPRSILSCS
jgi:hypothetical protein